MSDSETEDSAPDDGQSGRRARLGRIGTLIAVLVIAVGLTVGLGLLPNDGGSNTAGTATPTPVPTISAPAEVTPVTESGETAGSDQTPGSETPTTATGVTIQGDTRQFRFEVLGLESCGQTCRDAHVELTNSGESATDVAATSRLYAGGAGDDQVWEGTEQIGDMDAGETVERTVRIELSVFEASKVCGAEQVTLVTTVASAEHKQQFTSHPDIGC